MPFEILIDFGHFEDLKLVPFLMGPTFVTQYWVLGMLELSFFYPGLRWLSQHGSMATLIDSN